jgi:hypothetical protein
LLEKLGILSDVSLMNMGHTICTGKSGLNFLCKQLNSVGIIDNSDLEAFCFDDDLLARLSLLDLEKGNYDYLHGAMGTAYYLLYSESQKTSYFEKFFEILKLIYTQSNNSFYSYNNLVDVLGTDINLGLAHGIPAILKFCIQSYRQGICPKDSKELGLMLANALVGYSNNDKAGTYYSYTVDPNKGRPIRSRLAWCYGDLSTAYVLYQAGETFGDKAISDFAMSILLTTTKRSLVEDTMVVDPGICHGSAGLVLIYNMLWNYTNNPEFEIARDFWLKETLNFAHVKNEIRSFERYNTIRSVWESDFGMLEGCAGVGLVLNSLLSKKFTWSYCLMLN